MKKFILLLPMVFSVLIFAGCHGHHKNTYKVPHKKKVVVVKPITHKKVIIVK